MFNKRNIITLVLAAIATVFCSVKVAESQEYLTDGLVGFWTMDKKDTQGKTVKDVSGNGHDGTIEGDPKPINGKLEEALHFDGKDDYIQLPDMGEEMQTSAEIWAYAEDVTKPYSGLVANHQWTTGCIHFKLEPNKVMVIKNGQERVWGPVVEPEEWYHFAYTADAEENEMKLYMNGELVQEGKAGTEAMSLNDVRIGDEYTDPRLFTGILDEVRIYKRVLSEKEIEQNYKVKSNELAVNPAFKLSICWGKIKTSR